MACQIDSSHTSPHHPFHLGDDSFSRTQAVFNDQTQLSSHCRGLRRDSGSRNHQTIYLKALEPSETAKLAAQLIAGAGVAGTASHDAPRCRNARDWAASPHSLWPWILISNLYLKSR